ncbi:MAG: MurR/RpiR family transcriptional regulator [Acidimicrobiaceae bacterium]|nr:MurR/RpiR family transcriptional regulator [Acidimicrobiaceae bacterium]
MANPEAVSPSADRDDRVLSDVRALRPTLRGALGQVADFILAEPEAAARATIVALAEGSGTSQGTVTRFCRALGLDGYPELRFRLARETARAGIPSPELDIGTEIRGDSLEQMAAVVAGVTTRTVSETIAQLDLGTVEKSVQALTDARRVDIYGVGGSAFVAKEMALRLCGIGVQSAAWSEIHDGLMSAALLGPHDVALGISNSGETRETIEMLAEAGRNGATTIALTGFPQARLAEVAELVLTTRVQEMSFRPRAVVARHAQLLVLDLLYVAVALRREDATDEAVRRTMRAIEPHRAATSTGDRRRPR